MPEALRFNYTVTPDDVVALQMHVTRLALPSDSFFPYERLSVTMYTWLGAGALATQPGGKVWAAMLFGFGAAYPFLGRGSAKRQVEGQFRRLADAAEAAGLLGPVTLTLTGAGLVEDSDSGRAGALWEDVVRMTEADGRLFIFLDEQRAAIVPRREFRDVRDYWAVREFVRSRLAERHR